ncbi:MAG: hypothetical protein AAF583_02110 [Pseudomonadota bacterium]
MIEETDYLQTLGISALGTRLRRLFESLNVAVSQLYRDELGFEQRWFALTRLLDDRGALSVQHCANALGVSHVSILQTSKAMEDASLLQRAKSNEDKRVSLISLTNEGKAVAARVQKISDQVDRAATELLGQHAPEFLIGLTHLEDALRQLSFSERLKAAAKVGKKHV